MKNVPILIIGAGVSGLTFAANTESEYYIVEKEDQPGGLCKTFYQDGFVWDYAGHFFHFANPDIKKLFEERIKPNDMVKCNKTTNINYNGLAIDYPFQMNIHQLPQSEFIDCLYDLFHRTEKEEYESFEDMLYGKFGESITNKFLKPYNEKLYACNLNDLDTDAMGRFFPYANPVQIIENMKHSVTTTYNSTFDYPKKGAQFFIDMLLEQIISSRLSLNSTVEEIDSINKIAMINGEEYHYEVLVNTIPLNSFIQLLPQKIVGDLGKCLSCNKVLVFNMGFDKQANDKKTHWTYFPMKDINFYRVGYYSNILNQERLSIYVEIGFKEDEIIDIDKQLDLTLKNLHSLAIITDHNLVAYNSLVINPGYVHITKESLSLVEDFRNAMRSADIYTIGRYGKWTYCSIEDCMIEATQLAKEIGK